METLEDILAAHRPFKDIVLGKDECGRPITAGYRGQLENHVHVVGLSGKGKSRGIEYILQQFLLNRIGFTLIDPHGDIHCALVAWLSRQMPIFFETRAIHLFDPSDPSWRFGYNPLHVSEGMDAAHRTQAIVDRVDALMEAVSAVMGEENPGQMPLYQRTFSTVLYTLAERGLTLYESMRVLPVTEEAFRNCITHDLPDPVAELAWREMNSWTTRQYTEFMGSLYSRMHRMMRHPFVRQVFGRAENVLDIRRVMDRGEVVLANFSQGLGFSGPNADLMARILISDYYQTALTRPPNASRPHFLVIDECYRYLTQDIERTLDETRKYGLHLVLGHQRLSQLGKPEEPIYEGVMDGAQNKLIFGVGYRDAQVLADRYFSHLYHLERPVEALIKPTVVDYETVTLHGESESEGEGTSWNASSASMSAAVASYGTSYDAEGLSIGSSSGGASSEQAAKSSGEGGSRNRASTMISHEALKPVLRDMASAVHSLENERHRKAVELMRQPRQSMIVRLADYTIHSGTTVSYDRFEPFRVRLKACYDKLFEGDPCNMRTVDVARLIEERWRFLDELIGVRSAPAEEEPPLGPPEHTEVKW